MRHSRIHAFYQSQLMWKLKIKNGRKTPKSNPEGQSR